MDGMTGTDARIRELLLRARDLESEAEGLRELATRLIIAQIERHARHPAQQDSARVGRTGEAGLTG